MIFRPSGFEFSNCPPLPITIMQITSNKNLPPPVYSLPDELLAIIFESANKLKEGFEVTLSHVNQQWCHVMIGLLVLWSDICITSFQSLEMLEMYLA